MTLKYLGDFVGNTPLVQLKRLPGADNARRNNVVLAKLEGNNPAGSVKNRAALSMIARAEQRGRIRPGDTLIEATSGTALILFVCTIQTAFTQSGIGTVTSDEAKEKGKASIYVYWYESRPFIYQDEKGEMQGIEEEIITGFKTYAREKHNVDITIVWKETKNFENTYQTICDEQTSGGFRIVCVFDHASAQRAGKFYTPLHARYLGSDFE